MSDEILEKTFIRIEKRLKSIAKGFLRDDEEARDALQDAFCKLWTRPTPVESEEEATALSVTTVRNLCISSLRARRDVTSLDESEQDMADDAPNYRQEREEKFRMVDQLMEERLSPLQSAVLRRHEYEGESIESIASDLRMDASAVRMNLSRARKTIRELYKESQQ